MSTAWGVRNGLLAHAIRKRRPWDTMDAALCGAARGGFRPTTDRDVKCIRCSRILGRETPKKLRVKITRANAELRKLYAMAR